MRVPMLLLFALVQTAVGQVASGGDFTLEKVVIANGGGRSSDLTTTLGITGTIGQSAAGSAKMGTPFLHPVGFWTPDTLAPSAATSVVSGQVTAYAGTPISNAVLTLMSPDGTIRTAATNTFGRFRFEDVQVGQTYILTVASRRYIFPTSPMFMDITDDVTDLTITAANR